MTDYMDIDADRLREFIAAQMCPWCPRGPFRVLAKHTSLVHAISATEIREMAGMFKGEQICSPEASETLSRAQMSLPPHVRVRMLAALQAGLTNAERAERTRATQAEFTPEQRADIAARANTAESAAAKAKAKAEWWASRTPQERSEQALRGVETYERTTRVVIMRERMMRMTPEERAALAAKAARAVPEEVRRQRAAARWTDEHRADIAAQGRARWEGYSEERKREITAKRFATIRAKVANRA